MATTKIWDINNNLYQSLWYIYNPDKTDSAKLTQSAKEKMPTVLHETSPSEANLERCLFVYGVNCADDPGQPPIMYTRKELGRGELSLS